MSTRAKISSARAKKAFEYAEKGKSLDKQGEKDQSLNEEDKYGSYVKRLPMLIRTNGLGNAIAFLYSNRNKNAAWGLLYKQLDDWFYNEPQKIIAKIMKAQEEETTSKERVPVLMKTIIHIDDNDQDQVIRLMTMEVLALANWLKRFV